MCVPWELNPQHFALLLQCSTTEPQEQNRDIHLRDIHLSKGSIVFQVTILFILMFQNYSLVCFSKARTAAYSYKCTKAMTGDFPLIIGLIFKTLQYAFRKLEYEMSCLE